MSKIFFFCIPAWGHTNPTIPVVEELVKRGHQVRYYSFEMFREKIESTGAEFVCCDPYLPELTDEEMDGMKNVSPVQMTLTDIAITIRMDPMLSKDVKTEKPDCIVADSVCFWGKLIARKYGIPFVSSTTTFAFNRYSSRYIKNSFRDLLELLLGMPKMKKAFAKLEPLGYHVENFMSIIQNDNDTNTIVYTSKNFQPCADTFSEHYAFVGPSVKLPETVKLPERRKRIYISMGTVLENNEKFYQNCVEALKDLDVEIIISAGKNTDLSGFGTLPENISIYPSVNQLEVLSQTDVFLTHCGMNSVSESLYLGVPMVLYPRTGEQKAVAQRAFEVGTGEYLKSEKPEAIREAVMRVLSDGTYKASAEQMRADFTACSHESGAADFIEKVIEAGKSQEIA